MRTCPVFVLLTMFLLLSCSTAPHTTMATPASRVYHGTASVGDFMTITIDSNAETVSYTDVSNNTSGTVPYTVNSDGGYTLNDPAGNLVAAYEVPNYAMVIQAAKTGPTDNTLALVTAVESGQISLATFEGRPYNFMSFRTAAGGVEAGSVSMSAQGSATVSSFWPYGAFNPGNQGSSPFNNQTMDFSQAQLDPSGTFLTVSQSGQGTSYVFGTANGIFAVDTQNGAILGLTQAASPNFDPTVAGSYNAIYYQKTGASTGQGNVETGTPSQGNATLTVGASGQVTFADAQGNPLAQGTLTPVAEVSYLYGTAGQLSDPCYGLFTFRLTTANSQQDVFVGFLGQAMLFSSFTANLSQPGTYSYFYGVGLK